MQTELHSNGSDTEQIATSVLTKKTDDETAPLTVDPKTAAFLEKLEKDPALSRRLWSLGVIATAAGLSTIQICKLFEKPQRKNATSDPVIENSVQLSAELDTAAAEQKQPEAIERESIWDREPGKIMKGETIYVPCTNSKRQKDYMSLQFKDEGKRKTLLLINGEECEQTADGFPIKITDIELVEGGKIIVTGMALFIEGTSEWTAKEMEDLHFAISDKGQYAFTVTSFLKQSEGLIRRIQAEPLANADEEGEK